MNQLINDEIEIKYYNDLETEWRNSLSHYSEADYLKIFPEAKKIVPIKIAEFRTERAALTKSIIKTLDEIRFIKDAVESHLLKVGLKINAVNRLGWVNKRLNSLDYLQRLINGTKTKGLRIEQARQVPILNFLNSKVIKAGKNFVTLCPFHQEKTPSFYVYPDNHFYCFGCSAHGSVIDLAMKTRSLDFIGAVKLLTGES